jgi:hypothetical protein
MEERNMTVLTVEQKIMGQYNCPVEDLLKAFANEGLTSKQVALRLNCGVSNVRRIARKYQIQFNQPSQSSPLLQDDLFKSETINVRNFLSRAWGSACAPRVRHA